MQLNRILCDILHGAETIFGEKLGEVILYGSYARGDHDDESDIDIMILVDISREEIRRYRPAITDLAWRLGMDHDVLISISANGLSYFHEWRNDMPFYHNVWREGRRLSA